MKRLLIVFVLLVAPASEILAQDGTSTAAPDTVVITNGPLKLKGLLWKPHGTGPFPGVLFNHGIGPTRPTRADSIGPVFAKHGYVLLFLFRRGDGLSADQGQSMRDVVGREIASRGEEASERLKQESIANEHLTDVLAGWALLKTLAHVDSQRLAMVGHSFGGQLTLYAAERDRTILAAVTFGAAAQTWDRSPLARDYLGAAARNIEVPVLLIHAANDFSIRPGEAIAAERARALKPYELKIYPAVGPTPRDGHAAVYTDVATWESDAFRFLDTHVRTRKQ